MCKLSQQLRYQLATFSPDILRGACQRAARRTQSGNLLGRGDNGTLRRACWRGWMSRIEWRAWRMQSLHDGVRHAYVDAQASVEVRKTEFLEPQRSETLLTDVITLSDVVIGCTGPSMKQGPRANESVFPSRTKHSTDH